jgi:hypothetical protein
LNSADGRTACSSPVCPWPSGPNHVQTGTKERSCPHRSGPTSPAESESPASSPCSPSSDFKTTRATPPSRAPPAATPPTAARFLPDSPPASSNSAAPSNITPRAATSPQCQGCAR